jgi:hypothetical protein
MNLNCPDETLHYRDRGGATFMQENKFVSVETMAFSLSLYHFVLLQQAGTPVGF